MKPAQELAQAVPEKLPEQQPESPKPEAPRRFGRRELLQIGKTSAVAAGAVCLGVALTDRDLGMQRKTLPKVPDHRVALPAGGARMAVARGKDPAENVRRAIEALGGMGVFIRRGDKVAIKPNVGWNRLIEQGANTNPEVVGALVRMAFAAGASKVWVTDYPVNNPERCFERSGIRKAVGEAGGDLVMPDAIHFREVEIGGRLLRSGEVLTPIIDADKLINVPIVKHHGLSRATLSMKNWYGILGGHRVRLHQDIHRSIVDLAVMAKPTLTVMDATRILMANGPTGGNLDDVKMLDTVAVGVDEVALDAFGAELLGADRSEVGFIAEGEKAGLGVSDYRSLKLVEIPG